ncbi:MAG: hypothetical protein IID08_09405 [Candidatus Hydrogenedentes bacterium]|nr:hypothetical protein [Candidatus Hydrogenedentota bacterium]
MPSVLTEGILSMPIGWMLWVMWMMALNTASMIFCWKKIEARFVLAAWIPNGIFMTLLAEQMGYTRILGLSHVIFWTPLVIYLFTRRKNFEWSTTYGKWLYILLVTNVASLVIDYIDVIRYIAGDRDTVTFN